MAEQQNEQQTESTPDEHPTTGTNRDFDESGDAENQGHGHPRDKQERGGRSGESLKKVTEEDRRQRDPGGPGG